MTQSILNPKNSTMRRTTPSTFFSKSLLLSFILLLPACGGAVKLIDLPKTTEVLNLSEEQQEVIPAKIALLQDIVEDYQFEKDDLKADYFRYRSNASLSRLSRSEGGGFNSGMRRERNQMRTKLRNFVIQRKEYGKEISNLIGEIKANLNPRQLVVFEGVKLPELELPDMLQRRPYDEFGLIPGTRGSRPGDFFQPRR